MKTKLLLIISFMSISLLSARDVIKDPDFKKEDKYWHLQLKNEYKNLKPVYKKGEISFNISHTSEHYYISLLTETRIKEGKTYQLSFKFKGNGQGKVYVTHRCHPNVFKGKRFDARKDKLISLGLVQTFEPKPGWQEATCVFVAQESPQRHLIEALIFMLGTYKGEVSISDLSFTELKESDIIPNERTGHIEIKAVK